MQYRWNWSVLFVEPYLGWLLTGVTWTLLVAGAASIVALAIGGVIGVLSTLPNRMCRAIATAYVDLFRNVPLLLQMFLWYFVLPELLPAHLGLWVKRDLPTPEYWFSVAGLGCFTAARIAEQVRAGIESIGTGQRMAAAAMGFTLAQTYRYILLPLATRNVLPPLTSEALNIIKNSSLALTIGVLELTGQSRQIEASTFQGIEALTAATIIYVMLTLGVIAAMRTLERRISLPGTLGRG